MSELIEALGMEVFFGPPLIAFGFWLSWWGLNAADWRDRSMSHVFECSAAILIGAGIAASGFALIVF